MICMTVFDFAVFVRCNDDAFINGHCSCFRSRQVPGQSHHPRRNPPQLNEHDQDGADKQLVGKGVQKLFEARNHIPLTGNMPIKENR